MKRVSITRFLIIFSIACVLLCCGNIHTFSNVQEDIVGEIGGGINPSVNKGTYEADVNYDGVARDDYNYFDIGTAILSDDEVFISIAEMVQEGLTGYSETNNYVFNTKTGKVYNFCQQKDCGHEDCGQNKDYYVIGAFNRDLIVIPYMTNRRELLRVRDGKEYHLFTEKDNIFDARCYNGYVYYSMDTGTYRLNLYELQKSEKILDNPFLHYMLYFINDKIYYISEDYYLHCCELDGTNDALVCDIRVFGICYNEGIIYLRSMPGEVNKFCNIFALNINELEGKPKLLISDYDVMDYWCHDNMIYFTTKATEEIQQGENTELVTNLYCYNIDDCSCNVIYKKIDYDFIVTGDKNILCKIVDEDGTYYQVIDTKGNERVKIDYHEKQ